MIEVEEDGTIWWRDLCGNSSIQDAFWVSYAHVSLFILGKMHLDLFELRCKHWENYERVNVKPEAHLPS